MLPHTPITTQSATIIYFIQRLDIEMVNDILDDGRTYQNLEKSIFIDKLRLTFDEFLANGDTFLHCYSGSCNEKDCNFKCTGYSFIGNHTKNYLDIIFTIKEGRIVDMYECVGFRIEEHAIRKNHRMCINKFDGINLRPPPVV